MRNRAVWATALGVLFLLSIPALEAAADTVKLNNGSAYTGSKVTDLGARIGFLTDAQEFILINKADIVELKIEEPAPKPARAEEPSAATPNNIKEPPASTPTLEPADQPPPRETSGPAPEAIQKEALPEKDTDASELMKVGVTDLMLAAQNGNGNLVGLLLKEGADVNARTDDGVTALMLAAQGGHTGIVLALLDKGADIDAATNGGTTAFMLADAKGHAETANLLLAQGAVFSDTSGKNVEEVVLHAEPSAVAE